MTESQLQQQVRLELAQRGWLIWRNNTGVAFDKNGRPIRYGLANDSKTVNSRIKSADLIGVRPVTITPDMVGQTIGQFVALEIKKPGWRGPNNERERAQERFLLLVDGAGGLAEFVSDLSDLDVDNSDR